MRTQKLWRIARRANPKAVVKRLPSFEEALTSSKTQFVKHHTARARWGLIKRQARQAGKVSQSPQDYLDALVESGGIVLLNKDVLVMQDVSRSGSLVVSLYFSCNSSANISDATST